jgi:hypothetical protein
LDQQPVEVCSLCLPPVSAALEPNHLAL